MASLSLKVHLCSQQTVKTLQFDPSFSVHEACLEIRRKLGEAVGGDDHALFWPTKSKWLVPTKTLAFYELAPGDTVEFKKRHRMLRIRLLDDTIKTVLIDDSLPVLLLAQSICSKIGIANQDEYSLALEEHVDVTKGGKKKTAESTDNVTWLNPEKSLPEQGVEESATLLLKKKFFYSDQNVDRTDPIQLHLIYQQSRDGIVSGKHACTVDEAVQFAALQMQVVHGNHDDAKHKVGFLNLREFLPEEYRKAKDIEKRIYAEHRKLVNMPELTVKHRYVQLCRSLKTYGVTFFAVKEKDTKKNKVVSRLIGISKDAILRCDAESKEVLQTWPLTSLRRWAASPAMFTMDFGDYQDAFYSVQTTQGEQMSQLIAGYIDIIIKRKKEADRAIATGAEEVITTEEVVRPARAQAIAIKPAQVNTAQEIVLAQQGELASEGANAATVGQAATRTTQQAAMSSIQPVAVNVVNPPSPDPGVAAVIARVNAGQSAVQALTTEMTLALAMPVSAREASPTDPARLFAQTTALAHLASHLAAAAAVVQATSFVDTPAIAHHVGQLSTNLGSLGAATKTLHANGAAGQLPELTRDIANATNRLLATIQEAVTTANPTRETLLAAAQAVTTASVALLTALNYPSPSHPPAAQRKVQDAAKHVSVAMQDLVNKAKRVAGEMATKEAQMRLIEHVKLGATAASQVAVSSAILAPLAATSMCKQGLADSANAMRSTVEMLVSGAATSVPPGSENLANLRLSAQAVSNALDALLQQASVASVPPSNDASGAASDVMSDDAVLAQHCDKVRAGCALVQNALGGEPGAIVAGVKSLTMSSTELVNALKRFAALAPDDDSRNKLVDAAKALAETTTRMVSAAKESARNPQDTGKQDAVKTALDSIVAALHVIQHPDSAAVTDMLATTHSLVVSSVVLACDPNVVNAPQLAPLARKVLEGVREHSVAAASYGPGASPRPLMNSTRLLADSVQALLMAAMQVPEVAVASAAQVCAQDVHTVGAHVGKVANLANSLELAAVVQTVSQLKTQTVVPTSPVQQLHPLDLAAVKTACKDLGSTLAQLVGNATQGKDTGEAATKVQAAITSVVQASTGMPEAERVLVVDLLDRSLSLLSTVQTSPRDKTSLADAVKALNGSVVKLLEGATQVAATKKEAAPLPGPTATASLPVSVQASVTTDTTREAVVGASSAMVTAISQLVTAKTVSGDIKKATGELESAFRQLVSASKLVIPQANSQAKAEILDLVQAASAQCVELIGSTKQQATTQAASPSREALSNAASSLGASVNKLMEKCAVVGNLGDVEVMRAMQALEMAAARLASPMLPTKIGDLTFSECLGKVVDDSRQIAQIMSTALKAPSATSPSSSVVSGTSNSTSALSPSAAGPIDPAVLTQLCQVVASIADTAMFAAAILSPLPINSLQPLSTDMSRDLGLLESATSQQAVLDAASGVGVATNGVCALIKTRAASLSVTEQERAELVEMATTLASASQHLIHAVKAYAVNMTPENKEAMMPRIPPVRNASEKVYAFSTEAAGPIRAAARKVVDSTRSIVLTTTDRGRIVQHGTALGHHLSGLVTSLRDVAPGQRELAAAIDRVHVAIAAVDEQLLASAVEGTKVALCSELMTIEACATLNKIVFGWTTENARIERDPARPVHAADAFTSVTQSITDSAMLELVKSIGTGLLRVMDNLKFSRPPDALPAVEVGEDLVAILELRNHMHERIMAPLNSRPSAEESSSPDALQSVQGAAKDLVGLISKCKNPSGLRTGQFTPRLVAAFDRLCQVAKSCEEQTNDVVIRDRLHGSLERLGAAVLGVLLDRSKVSQLSSAIQALVATIQESVRAAAQCLVTQQSISTTLLPSLHETIAKIEAGELIQVVPVAPGALQLRCNQLLESLNALISAAESNMDTALGDAAEGSLVILKQLVEDARKHAVAQKSADSLKTVDEILGSWSSLVQVASRAVTKAPSDPIFESVQQLGNKIARLVTSLTSNESQQEFQKLASVLEAAIKALPVYENESREQQGGALQGDGSTDGIKSAEEWEQVRNIQETRAVAMTTFDLIKAAAMCQREVSTRPAHSSTPTSPTSGSKYMDDGTWSDGLVSAAKQVAQAMQELIATATPSSDGAQPAASRERLIACAKAVASATVQVVAAASVKSEANAPSLVKLKSGAKTVVQTAETMVNKIKTSSEIDKGLGEELLNLKPSSQTSARLALLEAQTSVLTMEAELERARARLTNIKKARYSSQPEAPAP